VGRRPIGDRAMSPAERYQRFLARTRAQAAATATAAKPAPTISADGITIRVRHLAMDPARSAAWLVEQLGLEAAGAFRDALRTALDAQQRPAFKVWLTQQPVTDDAAGDFVRDAKTDSQLPDDLGSWEALAGYLRSRGVDADTIDAAEMVWERYASC